MAMAMIILIFSIVFHDNDGGYWFYANSARETDEWIRILNCSR